MSGLSTPDIVARVAWQRKIDELRPREKAHTREADAVAAARRRLADRLEPTSEGGAASAVHP